MNGAPDALRCDVRGQPHGRALECAEVEVERGRVAGSGGDRARVELLAVLVADAERVEDLAVGDPRPQAAEDGLPASAQLVGRAGDDGLVLAAGRLLASLIRGTPTSA